MKNFKNISIAAFAFLMGGQLIAQTDSTSKNDTVTFSDTEVRLGNVKITFEDDNSGVTNNPDEKRKYPNVDFMPSFDFGVAGYQKDYNGETWTNGGGPVPEAAGPVNTGAVDLDFARSRNIGINGNLIFNITKNFGFVTGLGLNYNTYRFRENVTVTTKEGSFMLDTLISYSKYKFRNSYVQLPLMLKLQSSNENFQFAFGGTLGYNFKSKVKAEYALDGGEYELIIVDNFNVEPLKISLGARFNYKGVGLYFNYGLTEVLNGVDKNLNGYNLMPFEAGITLGSF